MIRNDKNELVPNGVLFGWHVCIDHRNLNADTRKDDFYLPFKDLMIERLAGYIYYYFLDRYSGYTQNSIVSEDQDRTLSYALLVLLTLGECRLVFIILPPLFSVA